MDKFKIKKEDEGKRLDMFLKEHYPSLSRSFLQKKIKNGEVEVNGEISAAHRFLKEGDYIEFQISNPFDKLRACPEFVEGTSFKFQKNNKTSNIKLQNKIEQNSNFKLSIIFETDDYVVINKPCGLVVHHGEKNETGTLADILKDKYPKIKDVGEDPLRPGIVHRLDKEVSGIMVVAKTQKMFECLKKQFQERTTKKEYIALVYGLVQKPDGVIDFPIARSEKDGTKMAARPVSQGGREAITEFTVLKHLAKWSLLSVKIKTGRTHQIRVHLNAYGHPIVGDKIYKPKKLKPVLRFGERLMLHSRKLGFTDLAGECKEFETELPREFARIMAD